MLADSLANQATIKIPLRFGAKLDKGWSTTEYQSRCFVGRTEKTYGPVPRPGYLGIDLDPKNNPNVFQEFGDWYGAYDSLRCRSKSGGLHMIVKVPMELEIAKTQLATIKGVDIQPAVKSYLRTDPRYGHWQGDRIAECHAPLLQYFRDAMAAKELQNSAKFAENCKESDGATTLAEHYMAKVNPEQEYHYWLRQVDALTKAGATVNAIMRWCATGGKYKESEDRRIVEHATGKRITLTGGWLVSDFQRKHPGEWIGPNANGAYIPPERKDEDVPYKGVQTLRSKRWNRNQHAAKQKRVEMAGELFFRARKSIEHISAVLSVDRVTVRRYCKQFLKLHGNSMSHHRMLSYSSRLSYCETAFQDVCEMVRAGKGIKEVMEATGVSRATYYRYKKVYIADPCCIWSEKRLERGEPKAKVRKPSASNPKIDKLRMLFRAETGVFEKLCLEFDINRAVRRRESALKAARTRAARMRPEVKEYNWLAEQAA